MEKKLEQALIGSMIVHPEEIQSALEIVTEKDFRFELFRKAFECIRELFLQKSEIELNGLYLRLNKPSNFHLIVEGMDEGFLSPSYYAKLLKKENIEQEIKQIAEQRNYEDLKEKIKQIEQLGKPIQLFDLQKIFESFPEAQEKFETGIVDLDKFLVFQPTDLLIIAGNPSTGKTTLGIQIISHMAKKYPVALISFEMSLQSIAQRLSLMFPLSYLDEINDNFVASSPPVFSTATVRNTINQMISLKKIRVVMIDYLQLIQEPKRFETRRLEVTFAIRSLKEMAKQFNIGMIVISSLSRHAQYSEDTRPTMGMLKESGDIEYSADSIIFLHRPRSQDDKRVEIILEKNRHGEAKKIIYCVFNEQRLKFEPWEYREQWYDK